MTQVLHHIRTLSYIDAGLLQNITIAHGAGVCLNYPRNFEELPLVSLANCEVTSKVENRTKLFSATLTAHLSEHFDAKDRHLAFLATCVDGQRYLIGGNESPYPIVNTTDALPGRETDKSGCILTIEYTDTLGLLPVLDGF